jgi:hypothetical protein
MKNNQNLDLSYLLPGLLKFIDDKIAILRYNITKLSAMIFYHSNLELDIVEHNLKSSF